MTSDRLFTPRFFWMCAFTFTVFLSLFQLIPTAPFHVRDLGGGLARLRALPRLSDVRIGLVRTLHRRVRRPQRTAAHADRRQPLSGRLHGDL